jgi:hypothetical protein
MQDNKTTPTSPSRPGEDELRAQKYERTDAYARYVAYLGIGTLLMVLGSFWTITLTVQVFEKLKPAQPEESPLATHAPPPEPRLQVHEQIDYRKLRGEQLAVLGEYRWLNKQEGVVRIPIDDAIAIVLKDGIKKPEKPRSLDELLPPSSSEGKPGEAPKSEEPKTAS